MVVLFSPEFVALVELSTSFMVWFFLRLLEPCNCLSTSVLGSSCLHVYGRWLSTMFCLQVLQEGLHMMSSRVVCLCWQFPPGDPQLSEDVALFMAHLACDTSVMWCSALEGRRKQQWEGLTGQPALKHIPTTHCQSFQSFFQFFLCYLYTWSSPLQQFVFFQVCLGF